MKICKFIDLGTIGYTEAAALQQRVVEARKRSAAPDVLLLCEHPHVVTLGRNGKAEHLRVSEDALRGLGVEFHRTNRGGDITYHGPGQLVGYPILNLSEIRRDAVWYVRQLEEVMLRTTAAFGVEAFRIAGCTGVWVRPQTGMDHAEGAAAAAADHAKLGAIGVHLSRWVTSHGFAYNAAPDLRYFELIVPCGIPDCRSASLEALLGRSVERGEVAERLFQSFGAAFGLHMERAPRAELNDWLAAAEAESAPVAGA